jgi:hypothetical protein
LSGQCRWRYRLGAGSCRGRPSAIAQPSRDALGSELSVDDVLQSVMHQGQVRVHALEPGVLVLQFVRLRQVRERHIKSDTYLSL